VSVRRLLVGLIGAYGLVACGLLAGAEASSAAVPAAAGATWLSPAGSTFDSPVRALSGLSPRLAQGFVGERSLALSASSLARSSTVFTRWASGYRSLACDPSTWAESSFSPSLPVSPYPLCDPASYQVEVVQAVVDLRDVLVYGLGLLILTSAASMVLLMRR
jgi:hypothetical protein